MTSPRTATAGQPVRPWDSWHLHIGHRGAPATDGVLCAAVAPAVDWCRDNVPHAAWFFVRYWQYGPHVRLRMAGLDAAARAEVDGILRRRVAELATVLPATLTAAEYRRQAAPLAMAGEGGRRLDVGILWPAGVYRQAYVAEVDRYGGEDLMASSEALFQVASELALSFCRLRPPEAARSGLGLRALWAALGTLDEPRRPGFCQEAAAQWRSWGGDPSTADPAASPLPGGIGGPPPAPVERWADQLGLAMTRWQAAHPPARAERIFRAHVHMLHNRLGLSVGQERNHYLVLAAAFTPNHELATVAR